MCCCCCMEFFKYWRPWLYCVEWFWRKCATFFFSFFKLISMVLSYLLVSKWFVLFYRFKNIYIYKTCLPFQQLHHTGSHEVPIHCCFAHSCFVSRGPHHLFQIHLQQRRSASWCLKWTVSGLCSPIQNWIYIMKHKIVVNHVILTCYFNSPKMKCHSLFCYLSFVITTVWIIVTLQS